MRGPLPLLLLLASLSAVGLWLAWDGPGEGAELGPAAALSPGGRAAPAPVGPGEAPAVAEEASGARRGEALAGAPLGEAALVAASAGASGPGVPLLVGRVLRAAELPAPGAEVHLRRSAGWFTVPADLEPLGPQVGADQHLVVRTDAEGRFAFESVPLGDWSLAVRADGCAPLDRDLVRVPRHQRLDLGDLRLEPGIALEGRVVDAAGRGLAGVRILRGVRPEGGSERLSLPGSGIPLGESSEGGAFRVDRLGPGAWLLVFEAPGLRVAELSGTAAPGSTTRGLLVQLVAGQSIAGRVEGVELAGEPLRVTARGARRPGGAAQAEVSESELHRARHAEVRADGSFTVEGLSPGRDYRLMAYRFRPQAEPRADSAHAGSWERVVELQSAEARAGARDVLLAPAQLASIGFRVVDARSGAPVERFVASLSGAGLRGGGLLRRGEGVLLEHPGGEARFEGLQVAANGSATTLSVDAPGYEPSDPKECLLRPAEQRALGVLALRAAPSIPVRVLAEESGEPIRGARVLLARASDAEQLGRFLGPRATRDPLADRRVRVATTDEEGRALVTAFANEVCVLRADAPGYVESAEQRSAPPHAERAQELRLARSARAVVRVRDETGAALPGIFVERRAEGEGGRNRFDPGLLASQTSDEAGEVSFENLRPGSHLFRAQDGGRRSGQGGGGWALKEEARVVLASGESVEVELVLARRGGLRAILLEAGEPLVGALAVLLDPEGGGRERQDFGVGPEPRRTVSDRAGRISFQGLPAGPQILHVAHPQRLMQRSFEVELVPDPAELRIDLGLAIVEGRVLDEAGAPLPRIVIDVSPVARSADPNLGDFRVAITEDEAGEASYQTSELAERNVRTDADGRYALRGLRPDEALVVRASGRFVVVESRRIEPLGRDEVRSRVDFALAAAGCLDVALTNLPPGSSERYTLVLRRAGSRDRVAQRVQANRPRHSFQSLRPGRWTIEVQASDGRTKLTELEVDVQALATQRVDVPLP